MCGTSDDWPIFLQIYTRKTGDPIFTQSVAHRIYCINYIHRLQIFRLSGTLLCARRHAKCFTLFGTHISQILFQGNETRLLSDSGHNPLYSCHDLWLHYPHSLFKLIPHWKFLRCQNAIPGNLLCSLRGIDKIWPTSSSWNTSRIRSASHWLVTGLMSSLTRWSITGRWKVLTRRLLPLRIHGHLLYIDKTY
jgi:hypothetical protein